MQLVLHVLGTIGSLLVPITSKDTACSFRLLLLRVAEALRTK